MSEELDEVKRFLAEDGLITEGEDLFGAGLPTMLVVIGSYLYSGGNLAELEGKLLKRLSLLLDMHIHRDVQAHIDTKLH